MSIPTSEPTGLLRSLPPDAMAYMEMRDGMGDVAGAVKMLEGDSFLHALLRFATPRAYRSEDEIDEWMAHASAAVDKLKEMPINPAEAFDALFVALTFELAYTGRDITKLMCGFGDVVVDRIVRPLFPDLSEPIPKRTDGPLKVGYISHSMRNSNGANWSIGWLKGHAPETETYVFNLSPIEDHVTNDFKRHAKHYYKLDGPVPQAARFIKGLQLDALIYPDLGLVARNTQFAAMRLAPVQCTGWGHPVTSGLPTVDYYLSSDLMEPPNAQEHYRETLVRLPKSGLSYPRPTLPTDASRGQFRLPEGPITLMCQNVMKCVPSGDELFRRVADATGRPIVMVSARSPKAHRITQERMSQAGIAVIWVPALKHDDFLRLQSLCDVSIDTPAWNGGNTTLQALAMGKPVVTLPGEFMRGRHSLAFNQIAGVPDLIADSAEGYLRKVQDFNALRSMMVGANADALFDDPEPASTLQEFLVKACRG